MPTSPKAPDRHALVQAVPVLATPRLRLVGLSSRDAAWYLAHFSRPEIVSGTGWPPPDGLDGAREEIERYVTGLFEQRQGIRWGIVFAEAPESMVGSVGLFNWRSEPEAAAELGYDLAPEWWGRGLMSEAIGAVIAFAFDRLGLAYLEGMVLVGNDRSCRTLERMGFLRMGVLPLHGEDEHGVPHDEYHYVRRAPGIADASR
jgi:ribosomal-protein-alanine N-acetyltransferase